MTLETPVKELPRIGKITSKALHRLEIKTVKDLLFYFPYKYLDFSIFSPIKYVHPGTIVTIKGTIKSIGSRFSFKTRKSLAEAIISDDTGSIKITWFNQSYVSNYLQVGDEVLLSGRAEFYKTLQLVNPIYEKASNEPTHTGRIVPVYHLTEGLFNRSLRNLIKTILPTTQLLDDELPEDVIRDNSLLGLSPTIRQIHFPDDDTKLNQAKRRVVFEQLFIQQLAVAKHRYFLNQTPAPAISYNIDLVKKFLRTLPFSLTNGQKRAVWNILQDMDATQPMNRLLEGDVGSGKTLVALISALQAIYNKFQVALLAPTEILAKQHFDTFSQYLLEFKSKASIGLLTNHYHITTNDGGTPKKQLLNEIKKGRLDIIIGTHALLQEGLGFKKLGLVIIDEQHRFGVAQRSLLLKMNKEYTPHLLSMTATPIPRSLALSIYSDLKISTLKELPKGRQKIVTNNIPEAKRLGAYNFVKQELRAGRQAFIITPRVEEDEQQAVKSAKEEFKRLSETIFKDFKVGLLYGKMKGAEKDTIMAAFKNHELDILVATSVIEIGIDIPNATVIVIEGAERFGLAQLHQLRGRVGRGKYKSYCLLFTTSEDTKNLQRLEIFSRTSDGFKLAEMDLEQRGFGSLFGTEQTGFQFQFAQFADLQTLKEAKQSAEKLVTTDPKLKNYPLLAKKVQPLVGQIHLE